MSIAAATASNRVVSMKRAAPRLINRRTSIKFIVLTAAVLMLLFGKIYVKAMIIGEGYRIEGLRQEALAKDAELRALRLVLASASRPDVLTKRARSLGLRPALPQQLRRLPR